MNVIAVSVRQAKGKASRRCISATACLRSLSVLACAANSEICCKDIRLKLPGPESLSAPSVVFGLSTNLTVDLANSTADCEDGGMSCALAVEACPLYSHTSDTPLRSCASKAND